MYEKSEEGDTVENSGISCLSVKKNKILGYTDLCQLALFWVSIFRYFFLRGQKSWPGFGNNLA